MPGQGAPRIDPSLTPPPGAWDPEWRVLVAFYNATGGPDWRNNENWLTDEPLDSWYGVSTNFGRVTILSLPGNGLTGELPPELGGLSDLRELYLDVNQLTGEIPPELANLSNLTSLSLSRNQLTGEVPPELINLQSLQLLDVGRNQLTGCDPRERESLRFDGLPPCDPLLAAQTPTPHQHWDQLASPAPDHTLRPEASPAATRRDLGQPPRRCRFPPPGRLPQRCRQCLQCPHVPRRPPRRLAEQRQPRLLLPPSGRRRNRRQRRRRVPATTTPPPELIPGNAEPVAAALETLAGNVKWIAYRDLQTNTWSVYDPNGSFTPDQLGYGPALTPSASSIRTLTHLIPHEQYIVSVSSSVDFRGINLPAGIILVPWPEATGEFPLLPLPHRHPGLVRRRR